MSITRSPSPVASIVVTLALAPCDSQIPHGPRDVEIAARVRVLPGPGSDSRYMPGPSTDDVRSLACAAAIARRLGRVDRGDRFAQRARPSPGLVSSALVVTWTTPARAGAAATSNPRSSTSSTMPRRAPTAASLDFRFVLVFLGRPIAFTGRS